MVKRFIVLGLFAVSGLAIGAGGAYAAERDFLPRFRLYFEAVENEEKPLAPAPLPQSQPRVGVTVPVLVYHSIRPFTATDSQQLKNYSVEPSMFERQLHYLKDHGYAVVSFDAVIDYLVRQTPLPEKSVVLTLDDGWENQYTYAFPLIKKYGMSATFFIFTNAVGHKHFLTWDQVNELARSGMEVGGHSMSHPYLVRITDSAKLAEEITGGKKIIEEHIGRGIVAFAYPFGQYDEAVVAVVAQAGYQAARTLHRGAIRNGDDPYTLRAMQVGSSMESFISALHGL